MTPVNDQRPDPDALLKAVQAEEARERRGNLRIFFGASAGVGKTYAMLHAARQQLDEGVDVIIGVAETHGREDTQKLLEGIPALPQRAVEHRGVTVREFDLEGALMRKPQLMLVDELAHTNAAGSRHPKRWQDVRDLLDAGIDVYTALNVQHLESLNDVVAGITGVWVKETVPDAFFDAADDITLVDVPTDDLLERLHEGKVYIAPGAQERAAEHFFKKPNLMGLRELALRRTAERVDAQMAMAQPGRTGSRTPLADKILVCVGTDAHTLKILRTARRMAAGLRAPLVAVYVENDKHYRLHKDAQASVERSFRIAAEMSASTVVLQGGSAARTILDYARAHNVTKIVLGKRRRSRVLDALLGGLAYELIRGSGDIDVYVITLETGPLDKKFAPANVAFSWWNYAAALIIPALCAAISVPLRQVLDPANLLIVYLAGILLLAVRFGRIPTLLGSIAATLAFDYLCVEPYYSFTVDDFQYLVALSGLLITGSLVSAHAERLRLQARFSQARENNTAALYTMTRELSINRGRATLAEIAIQNIERVFDGEGALWLPEEREFYHAPAFLNSQDEIREESIARFAFEQRQIAGLGTDTLPAAKGIYLPLQAGEKALGVIGVLPYSGKPLNGEQVSLLETFASIIAAAMERASVGEQAETAKVEAEREKLRSTLLSSVSHDLRTPLTTITGTTASLLRQEDMPAPLRRELLTAVHQEASRLTKIVANLLDVTRLESGALQLNRQEYFIEELIGSALMRLEELLKKLNITTTIAQDMPLMMMDGILIEQVLVNLLENAARHTPAGGVITIKAWLQNRLLHVSVHDSGSGILHGDEDRIFEKFYAAGDRRGSGLGLAICRGIIHAHHGRINAANEDSGALFTFTLPVAHP